MIQSHLRNQLESALPSLEWTVDFKTANDNTGAVYYEGGQSPGEYDVKNRSVRYMVYISSSDWEFAEFAALKVIDLLHKQRGEIVRVDYSHNGEVMETKYYKVQWIAANGDINPIGIENNVMDYSVNFDVKLIEI